jgi:hypothetical protein
VESGLAQKVVGTAANVSDVSVIRKLLYWSEKRIHGDAGYQEAHERLEMVDFPTEVEWLITAKRGKIKAMAEGLHKSVIREWERRKSQVRADEHVWSGVEYGRLFDHKLDVGPEKNYPAECENALRAIAVVGLYSPMPVILPPCTLSSLCPLKQYQLLGIIPRLLAQLH